MLQVLVSQLPNRSEVGLDEHAAAVVAAGTAGNCKSAAGPGTGSGIVEEPCAAAVTAVATAECGVELASDGPAAGEDDKACDTCAAAAGQLPWMGLGGTNTHDCIISG